MHLCIKGSAYYYFKDSHLGNMAWWLKSADALNFELSGRVLDSRTRGRGFEPHWQHCVVVLEQDTFILA